MELAIEGSDLAGSPLAVCLNDCEIDCGQPATELAPICFRVGCAFAIMRWGPKAPAIEEFARASYGSEGR
jgi:hypothetical protein